MTSERPRRGRCAAALLLALITLPGTALAQQPSAADKETARSLMDKGEDRMEAKDYAGAVEAYKAADAIMHLPLTGVAVAQAQAAAGLLLEARDKAIEVTLLPRQPNETPAYARARAAAADLADTLVGRIPSIRIVLEPAPPGAVVAIDGVPLPAGTAGEPRKVNPGAHVVSVSAPGFATARVEVTVGEGVIRPVPVTLQEEAATQPAPLAPVAPPPAPPPRGVSPLAVTGFAVGGVSLVVGAITGGLSLSKTATLKGLCSPKGDCNPTLASDLSAANTLANVSNVTVGVGIAGIGLGVVGLFLSRAPAKTPEAARVEPLIGPRQVGVRGAF